VADATTVLVARGHALDPEDRKDRAETLNRNVCGACGTFRADALDMHAVVRSGDEVNGEFHALSIDHGASKVKLRSG